MINIAIDGPSGAGKSTIARLVAAKLGYIYVDTGALYRAVALAFQRSTGDAEPEIAGFSASVIPPLTLKFIDGVQQVFLGGENVSDDIRSPEISQLASKLSTLPPVREFLLETQRELAQSNNVIMDGRDIGSVVLPEANIKIFLTAAPEDRAKRRYDELLVRGVEVEYADVLREVIERDERDTNRAISPTRAAPDAKTIDTTGNTLEKSVDVIETYIRERLAVICVL